MGNFSSSMENWRLVMTFGPAAAGVLGVLVIRRYPHRYGWVFGAYTIVAVAIALAPFVLAGAGEASATVIQPVLREAKTAIAFGGVLLLGAAGFPSRRTRKRPL